jgi:hypothetical protein
MHDWRERRARRRMDAAAARARIAELNRAAAAEAHFQQWQAECGWDRGFR